MSYGQKRDKQIMLSSNIISWEYITNLSFLQLLHFFPHAFVYTSSFSDCSAMNIKKWIMTPSNKYTWNFGLVERLLQTLEMLVGWVLCHINLHRLFNAKSIFIQTISSISNNSVKHKSTQSKTFLFQAIQVSQTVLIQTIQFILSTDFFYTQLNIKTVLF